MSNSKGWNGKEAFLRCQTNVDSARVWSLAIGFYCGLGSTLEREKGWTDMRMVPLGKDHNGQG